MPPESTPVETAPEPVATASIPAQPPAPVTTPPEPVSGPQPVTAVAAAAMVTAEAPTYTFDGLGPSFVRDAVAAYADRDPDAAARLGRFREEMATNGPAVQLMLAAVETRTTAPELVEAERWRGDLLVTAIDRGRPLFSRLRSIQLTDASPFRIPSEGEFDGVGAHTEGTAHVAEGTLTLGTGLVTPAAVSGAYRVSRELVDSSNPAIDRIALAAMLRDYRRESEARVVTALETSTGAATLGVDTVAELRAQAIDFMADEDIPADFIVSGTGAYTAYIGEEASDGRPTIPYLGPTNAVGQLTAGYRGANLDGTPMIHASALDTTDTFLIRSEDVLVAESRVLTFRFDQPEGPGIIKLAIWAYVAAAVLRASGVRRLTTAAA